MTPIDPHLEKKSRMPHSVNPAISSLRPVAFGPRLATGLAFYWAFIISIL